jgi:hypothetical protein
MLEVSVVEKPQAGALWLSHCAHYNVEVAGIDDSLAIRR